MDESIKRFLEWKNKGLTVQDVDSPDIHSPEGTRVESPKKMDKQEALEIICMIADGLNPYKEQGQDKNIPEQHPATIRAICIAIASLITDNDKSRIMKQYHQRNLSELIDSTNGPLQTYLKKLEKNLISKVSEGFDYHQIGDIAELLEMPKSLLKKKLHEYDLEENLILRGIIESDLPLEQKISDLEAKLILEALWKCDHNKWKTADLLGIKIRSLRYRIEKLKIDHSNRIETIYFSMLEGKTLDDVLNILEKYSILRVLEETESKEEAARTLGLNYRSLRYRLEKYGIKEIEK